MPLIQIAVSIALTVLYVGISLALGGVRPGNGFIWWFFVPCIVMVCAGFIATRIMAILPLPWADGRRYGPPPRCVHLSWRAALRLPVYLTFLLIPWHMLTILRFHFGLDWVLWVVFALAIGMTTIIARRRRREIRLLRSGEIAMAFIDGLENTAEWSDDLIFYHFITAGGAVVSGRAYYVGYNVLEGSSIPVFYDADNPKNHVVACASWFEAD